MAHSSSTSWEGGYVTWENDQRIKSAAVPILADPKESNTLFAIPKGLSPVYRPLPILLRMISVALSVLAGIFTTWSRVTVLSVCTNIWNGRFLSRGTIIPWKDLIVCAIKSIGLYFVATGLLQELLAYRPGRIETQALAERYHLPTKLSRYQQVKGVEIGKIHWLQAASNSTSIQFTHAHFNHGFGASSLSWLPALPLMVDRLGIARAVAHDAPGFGFTDRTSAYIDDYSCQRSAEIGRALLDQNESITVNSTVLLVGHSLGAYTTLQMALDMDPAVKLRIILVSPAFGIRQPSASSLNQRRKQGIWSSAVDSVAAIALRKIVGSPGFIRRGLQYAWANPLKDVDVLRFQWPSIARGWERGLLRFARAPLLSDERLLRRVLALPNVEAIDVVRGGQDQIVKLSNIQKFFAAFPTISVSTVENCGHDPFEENEAAFVEHICGLLSGATSAAKESP